MASVSSAASSFMAQIQQQQAQRNADQAAQNARALRQQAAVAQRTAESAQESARSLKVRASQADTVADSARMNLSAVKSVQALEGQFADLRTQISEVLSSPSLTASVNFYGEQTGVLVNETA